MGQKVNPHGMRVGIIKDWQANGIQITKISLNILETI